MSIAKKNRVYDDTVIFLTGALSYTFIEMLWRGHSHWTMSLTGGACTLLIHAANRRMKKARLELKCVIGALIITGMEFVVGCIVNLSLGWNVWDYSEMPLNLLGQICLPFSLLWLLLSLPCIALSSLIESRRRRRPLIFDR